MELVTFEMRELKAEKGMVLTNGETYSSVGGSVFLGVNDKPENWHEITKAQYESLIEEKAKNAESEADLDNV